MNSVYDINELFPVIDEYKEIYEQQLAKGLASAEYKRVAVLCLARNISQYYKYALRKTRLLIENFHTDSSVYIYENDSIDDTPDLIKEHITKHTGYQNFHIFSEQLSTPVMPLSKSTIRTTNMANARNKCYKLIDDPEKFDYIIVLDLDFIDVSINGLINSFGWLEHNKGISAMSGVSYIKSPNIVSQYQNYDSFAFRLNYWKYREMLWYAFFNLPIGTSPIAVNSAFGGSCIYRQEDYKPLYEGNDCEHVELHKNLTQANSNFRMYCNPSQIMLVD